MEEVADGRRRMRVVAKEACADGVVGLELAAQDSGDLPKWQPGAHIDLHGPDGLVRQYSLCGRPGDPTWQVAVLRVPDGRGGSRWVHDDLAVDDVIEVGGPRNHFRLEPGADHLFIAGGIGITPILPMVREVAGQGGCWRLVYGGRTRESMAFADELLVEWPGRVRLVPEDQDGRLDLDEIFGEPVAGRVVYCCGPEGLLGAVEQLLAPRPEELRLERFSADVEMGGEAYEVEIASTGKRVEVAASCSIIDALAEAGIDVPFSCREGTCGTCETGVLGGVPLHRDAVLTDEERAAGDVMMICVGGCKEGPLILDL